MKVASPEPGSWDAWHTPGTLHAPTLHAPTLSRSTLHAPTLHTPRSHAPHSTLPRSTLPRSHVLPLPLPRKSAGTAAARPRYGSRYGQNRKKPRKNRPWHAGTAVFHLPGRERVRHPHAAVFPLFPSSWTVHRAPCTEDCGPWTVDCGGLSFIIHNSSLPLSASPRKVTEAYGSLRKVVAVVPSSRGPVLRPLHNS